ncbi:MAG: hypothetical protein IIA17_01170 [candidate division Zixibacteria bacterium]|nr:hypothetical protein [candidate division Zixibacteria bacterium]
MKSVKQLARPQNHQNYISIICFPLLFMLAANVWAGTETLDPDGDPTPDDWQLVNGTKHGAVSDADDATYIWNDGPGSEKLSMADNTMIPSDAIIDSVMIHIRAQKNFGAGSATIRARIFNGTGNYCDGNTISLTATLTDYVFDAYVSPPTGPATCSGSWTRNSIDSLDVQLNWVSAGDDPRVVKMYAVVHWTEAGSCDWQDAGSSTDGATWSREDSVFLSDDQRALDDQSTQVDMEVENFTIGAPAGATIDSIVVRAEGQGAANQATRRRVNVALTKNGTSEVGDVVNITFDKDTDAYEEARGSTNVLWGTTWTVAEVNATTFGVFINPDGTTTDNILVDHVQIKVCWTESSGEVKSRRRKIQMGNKNTEDIEYARLDK